MNVHKLLTNKKTVLALFLLLTVSFILANTLPQAGNYAGDGPAWIANNPLLAKIIRSFGLDSIFSTRWFFALALVFFLSLLSSTVDQGRRAFLSTTQLPKQAAPGGVDLTIPLERFESELGRLGYLKVAVETESCRHVKAPWGYWGNFLLHLGMTLTVLFSLVYVLTEQRVVVEVYQGVKVKVSDGRSAGADGMLARPMTYPAAARLDTLRPTFWDNGVVKTLDAELTFFDQKQQEEPIGVGVNAKRRLHRRTVYLNPKFGEAFFLEIAGAGMGIGNEIMRFPVLITPGKASYGKLDLFDGSYTLKGKYSEAGNGTGLPQPLLALRLYQGDNLLGEAQLGEGTSRPLGPFLVHLKGAHTFAELLFDGSMGVSGIFFGFFLTLCGALMLYFTVPRELVIRKGASGYLFWWKAAKFRELYAEEGERIVAIGRGQDIS